MKEKNTCYCRDARQTMDWQTDSKHTDNRYTNWKTAGRTNKRTDATCGIIGAIDIVCGHKVK